MKIYIPVFHTKYPFGDPQRHGVQEIDTDKARYCCNPTTDKITSILYRGVVYNAEYIFSSEKGARAYWENRPFIDRIMYDRTKREFVPYDFKRTH